MNDSTERCNFKNTTVPPPDKVVTVLMAPSPRVPAENLHPKARWIQSRPPPLLPNILPSTPTFSRWMSPQKHRGLHPSSLPPREKHGAHHPSFLIYWEKYTVRNKNNEAPIVQFYPLPCYCLPLGSEWLIQHPGLEEPQVLFFPRCGRQCHANAGRILVFCKCQTQTSRLGQKFCRLPAIETRFFNKSHQ
jgi:hypothetical protein